MRWSYRANDINHPLRHKLNVNWCATVSAYLKMELSVSARPSAAKNDERREGVRGGYFRWGISSAMKISCPSYLGPN